MTAVRRTHPYQKLLIERTNQDLRRELMSKQAFPAPRPPQQPGKRDFASMEALQTLAILCVAVGGVITIFNYIAG